MTQATSSTGPKRIYWHKFIKNHEDIFYHIEKSLAKHGFDLMIVLDHKGVCTDAYIVKNK
jgi:uncharacterized protein (DUF302 family)